MTPLMRQSLCPEVEAIERGLRRMFASTSQTFAPTADVYETPTEYVLELEVQAMKKRS
jgi:HSP20 family molecular chaperone IbpA